MPNAFVFATAFLLIYLSLVCGPNFIIIIQHIFNTVPATAITIDINLSEPPIAVEMAVQPDSQIYSEKGSPLSIYQQLCGPTKLKSFSSIQRIWRSTFIVIKIFALQFFLLSLYNYLLVTASGSTLLSETQIATWMILTIISFILTLAMLGLFFTNLLLIMKNITHIDVLKGNYRFSDPQGKFYNPYNIGCLGNYHSLFQGQLWTFWLPSEIVHRCDGVRYPMVPPITNENCKDLPPNIQQILLDPIEKSIPKTMKQLCQKQSQNYKNVVFFYVGQQYRLPEESKIQQNNLQQNKILPSPRYQQIDQQIDDLCGTEEILEKDTE